MTDIAEAGRSEETIGIVSDAGRRRTSRRDRLAVSRDVDEPSAGPSSASTARRCRQRRGDRGRTTELADCDEDVFDRLVAVTSIRLPEPQVRDQGDARGGPTGRDRQHRLDELVPAALQQSVYTATKHGVLGLTSRRSNTCRSASGSTPSHPAPSRHRCSSGRWNGEVVMPTREGSPQPRGALWSPRPDCRSCALAVLECLRPSRSATPFAVDKRLPGPMTSRRSDPC